MAITDRVVARSWICWWSVDEGSAASIRDRRETWAPRRETSVRVLLGGTGPLGRETPAGAGRARRPSLWWPMSRPTARRRRQGRGGTRPGRWPTSGLRCPRGRGRHRDAGRLHWRSPGSGLRAGRDLLRREAAGGSRWTGPPGSRVIRRGDGPRPPVGHISVPSGDQSRSASGWGPGGSAGCATSRGARGLQAPAHRRGRDPDGMPSLLRSLAHLLEPRRDRGHRDPARHHGPGDGRLARFTTVEYGECRLIEAATSPPAPRATRHRGRAGDDSPADFGTWKCGCSPTTTSRGPFRLAVSRRPIESFKASGPEPLRRELERFLDAVARHARPEVDVHAALAHRCVTVEAAQRPRCWAAGSSWPSTRPRPILTLGRPPLPDRSVACRSSPARTGGPAPRTAEPLHRTQVARPACTSTSGRVSAPPRRGPLELAAERPRDPRA